MHLLSVVSILSVFSSMSLVYDPKYESREMFIAQNVPKPIAVSLSLESGTASWAATYAGSPMYF